METNYLVIRNSNNEPIAIFKHDMLSVSQLSEIAYKAKCHCDNLTEKEWENILIDFKTRNEYYVSWLRTEYMLEMISYVPCMTELKVDF